MKPLILGEAPSRTGDRYHMFPLSGAVAERLCRLAAIPPMPEGTRYGKWTWALYQAYDCANLFDRYADATPWRTEAARERWKDVRATETPRTVVCLGRRVQRAVTGDQTADFHVWTTVDGLAVVTVPHPSGLNRILNDPEQRERAGTTLRRALQGDLCLTTR